MARLGCSSWQAADKIVVRGYAEQQPAARVRRRSPSSLGHGRGTADPEPRASFRRPGTRAHRVHGRSLSSPGVHQICRGDGAIYHYEISYQGHRPATARPRSAKTK
jgi:hypothetical protein